MSKQREVTVERVRTDSVVLIVDIEDDEDDDTAISAAEDEAEELDESEWGTVEKTEYEVVSCVPSDEEEDDDNE